MTLVVRQWKKYNATKRTVGARTTSTRKNRPSDMTDLESQLDAAWRVRQDHFPCQITFVYPLDTALISLTGDRCTLQCAHCGGRYLAHIQPIWEARVAGLPVP